MEHATVSVPARRARAHAGRRHVGRTVTFWVLLVLSVVWLTPFLFTVFTAMRQQPDLLANGIFALPETIYWQNIPKAWQVGRFDTTYWNSLVVTSVKVPAGILIASLAAFPLAKMRFPFSNSIFLFFLVGLTVPIHVTLLPVTILLKQIGLLGSVAALFPPYIAFGLPFQILVMRGFFSTIPTELVEAAHVDGASSWTVFWRIMLPLAKPALATLFIIDALNTWNEFLIALVVLQGAKNYTVPLGLLYFQGEFASTYGVLTSGVLIAIIPVLVVYLLFQRYMVSGITQGALKG